LRCGSSCDVPIPIDSRRILAETRRLFETRKAARTFQASIEVLRDGEGFGIVADRGRL
jgi:hypothetical protein